MTKLYRLNSELIFDEPFLNLKEAVEKHKDDLKYTKMFYFIL